MSYKIKDGDTLSGIAKANNTTVDAILKSNPSITNPNLIYAGQSISLPSSGGASSEAKTGGGALKVTGTKSGAQAISPAQNAVPKSEAQSYKEIYDSLIAEGYKSSYTGEWGEKRDSAIGEYEGLGDFEYDINSDIVYKQLADEYERSGRTAMEDAMGKSAAMTGGYGSSYGTQAGQQAFNSYMQELNSMIPELEERSFARDQADRQELLNLIAMYGNLDAEDYGRDRDARADWKNEVDDAYNKHINERDYEFSQKQYADQLKAQEIDILLALGDYNTLDSLGYDTSSLRAQKAAEAASKYTSADDGEDDEQPFNLWNYSGKETKTVDGELIETGNMIFYDSNNKKKVIEAGINPYTGTKNQDIEKGVFSNGYQPDNIGGQKLTKTGDTYNLNGREQNIWKTEDGRLWIWDGSKNRYYEVEIED